MSSDGSMGSDPIGFLIQIVLATLLAITFAFIVGCASKPPGAIGVMYNQDGVVRHIYSHSPAAKAGLLLGDIIENPKSLRGPVGTSVTISVIRKSKKLSFTLVRVNVKTLKLDSF